MVDVLYARGWDDCLEAVNIILDRTKSMEEVRRKIKQLQGLVKEKKFEKIKYELGAIDLF